MDAIYLTYDNASSETYERIRSGELEPYCGKCKAKVLVFRRGTEPDAPVVGLRCPTNQNHVMVSFTIADPEMDRIMGRAPAAPGKDPGDDQG